MMASSAESSGVNGAAAPTQLFVINLAASTSPMALSHPSSPELKRFTFFVSRQREEGRERFRLHMGYFPTQEEAETLLASVRDIYPAAWAGPAPTTGMGRRGRIAPGSVVAATTAPAPVPATTPAAAPQAVPIAVAPAVPAIPAIASSVAAVPAAAASPVRAVPSVATTPAAKPAAAVVPPVARPAAPASKASAASLEDTMSNVRDVLAQLSGEAAADAPTVQMRMPPALPAAVTVPRAVPVAKPAAPELSPKDALSLLETPARAPVVPPLDSPFAGLENEPEVRLVTPEDTQTLTDIKIDRQNNAPPCFAVQLVWSVSPVDVAALPHLAIFDAYTLYNVEGNRQGRKWYGLRLGFFSDPNSAAQVANYVRSDYKAVAVVPVAVKERDRARGGSAPPAAAAAPRKATENDLVRDGMEGFELLADDRPAPAKRDFDDAARGQAPVNGANIRKVLPAAAAAAVKPAPAPAALPPGAPKAAGKPVGKRVVARRRPPPVPQGRTVSAGVGGAEVLESTLEILGASTLSLDDGGRQIITDAAGRKPADKKSGGRFSRLLSRLSGG